ncbi:carboxypeptidase regulatory-like domain-containing protein, partial [Klebsiella pneumoniae]|uniref:SpaA isopeptide-forming pilin-related protein n=1 Tax=Klebsiella pneumoniae TaxID=573 RepID=UPI0020062C33
TSGVVVTPRPGVPVTIELPLVSAGEISGNLQREGGKNLSGVDIELLDKAGRVVKTTRSEYDGFFLFEFVPYGSYKLRVAAVAAAVVGVEPSLPGVAELGKAKGMVDLGIVTARAAQRIASAASPQGP